MLKCIARICKEYKRTKADSVWPEFRPEGIWIPNPELDKYPEVCGGDVTVTAEAWPGMYFGDVELEIKETCTRCKWPYYKGKRALTDAGSYKLNINNLIEEVCGQ